MTKFTAIDPDRRVWAVEDLLEPEQVQDLLSLDWLNLPWVRGGGQETWVRRSIDWQDPDVQRVSRYITDRLPVINQGLGTEFTACGGQFWLDEPGFTVAMHTDGELRNTMQIYWVNASDDYGTGFYYHKNRSHLMHQFASKTNTGYIMLNNVNADGSQPLLWHGMFNPVPAGHYRLSSYWYFN